MLKILIDKARATRSRQRGAGHIHITNPKEDAYIPDLLKITIRLFDREEIIEEIKKMLERCFTK